MRRLLLLAIVAVLAAALPAAADAHPAPPDPGTAPPAFTVPPILVRDDAHRVTLRLRLTRALERRYDGELLASAAIDGRIASVAPIAGRPRAYCYSARAWIDRARPGRLVAVSLLVPTPSGAPAAVSALVAVRAQQGAAGPPGC
jgi:hypothetical protein